MATATNVLDLLASMNVRYSTCISNIGKAATVVHTLFEQR